MAGARRDLDEIDAAVVALQVPELEASRRDPWSARLFYAYADNLLAAGRESDALQWFVHAADADTKGETDADARIADLTGEPLADDGIEFALDDEVPGDDPAAEARDDDLAAETGVDHPVAESSGDDLAVESRGNATAAETGGSDLVAETRGSDPAAETRRRRATTATATMSLAMSRGDDLAVESPGAEDSPSGDTAVPTVSDDRADRPAEDAGTTADEAAADG